MLKENSYYLTQAMAFTSGVLISFQATGKVPV